MKLTIGKAVMVLALLSGCGDAVIHSLPGDEPGAAAVAAPGGDVSQSEDGLAIEVRMRAVGAEQYASLILVPNRVEAIADGVRIPVTTVWTDVNLANMEHAEQIATLRVPEGTKNVAFRVELGAAGGFDTSSSSGWVDSRLSVLEFERSMDDLLRNHNRTVVVVNAAKSFIDRGDTSSVFVPRYRVY